MDIRLRHGGTLAQAIDAVRTCAQALQNVRGGFIPEVRLDAYLSWVDESYRQLANWLLPGQVERLVETPRYWALQRTEQVGETQVEINQLNQLITREVDSQSRRFEELACELEGMQRRWQRSTGLVVIPDTNVLLHHQREFQRIAWPEAVGCHGDVHLVIPLIVIMELDRSKRSNKAQVRSRARVTLRTLNALLPDPAASVELCGPDTQNRRTTVEFLVDPLGHDRLTDPDSEIVDRALYVAEISGRPVCIATFDTGMRLIAKAHGLQTIHMPEEDETSAPSGDRK